jgi:hypothetical protein
MEHPLFLGLDEMLSPASFGALEERTVTDVTQSPFHSVDALSGSRFLRITTSGSASAQGDTVHYILKRIAADSDWLMRATGDRHGRAALAWQSGILDRVPTEIEHGVVACAIDGDGRALLMRDLGPHLIPPGDDPISHDAHERFIAAMASLHAACWGQADLAGSERGFCSLTQHYHAFSPETGRREAGGSDAIPPMIAAGWSLLADLVTPDVAEIVGALLEDPAPLCRALEPHATTIIHGDWKFGNTGWNRDDDRVVLLDWDRVSAGPAGLDLAWYLAVNSARIPATKEEVIGSYTRELATRSGTAFDSAAWQEQLDLTLLGGFLQLGWPKLLGAAHGQSTEVREREQAELDWWSDRVRAGAQWLSHSD